MPHSVKLKTPVPSVEDFGKSLGISKGRQKALIELVRSSNTDRFRVADGASKTAKVAGLKRGETPRKKTAVKKVQRAVAR